MMELAPMMAVLFDSLLAEESLHSRLDKSAIREIHVLFHARPSLADLMCQALLKQDKPCVASLTLMKPILESICSKRALTDEEKV